MNDSLEGENWMHFLSAIAIREGKVEIVLGHARVDRCHGSVDRPAKSPRAQGIARDRHVPMICYTTTPLRRPGGMPDQSTFRGGTRCIAVALDQRGELFLIHATPEKFDLLDSRKISEQETWGHLAVSGEQVFVRELNGISTYHWK
jgi:hypothetical protein